MSTESRDIVAQQVWQEYVAEVGRSLPEGLADRMADAALSALTAEGYAVIKTGPLRITEPRDILERIVRVRPAYDCIGVQPCVHGSADCKPGTGGSHGRKSAEFSMTLQGPDADVTLVISTGWDLPTVPAHHRIARGGEHPRGSFVEIHTAHPRYEGQERRDPHPQGTCKDWADCYVDTGYAMSDEPTRRLVEQGSDATWAWLENLYATTQDQIDAVRAERTS